MCISNLLLVLYTFSLAIETFTVMKTIGMFLAWVFPRIAHVQETCVSMAQSNTI